jgi:hypothetical protein
MLPPRSQSLRTNQMNKTAQKPANSKVLGQQYDDFTQWNHQVAEDIVDIGGFSRRRCMAWPIRIHPDAETIGPEWSGENRVSS